MNTRSGAARLSPRLWEGGLWGPRAAPSCTSDALQGRTGREPSLQPPRAFGSPSRARAPTHPGARRLPTRLSRPGCHQTRGHLFPQRNPSAARRALVLITLHPPARRRHLRRSSAFPAASRNVASPNPATHKRRAWQPPAPPLVVTAAETATAAAKRKATPLRRLAGSGPSSPSPRRLRRFRPRAEQEGTSFAADSNRKRLS